VLAHADHQQMASAGMSMMHPMNALLAAALCFRQSSLDTSSMNYLLSLMMCMQSIPQMIWIDGFLAK
jgi:hypothetical protein